MRALAQRLTAPYGRRPGPGRTIGRATAALAIAAGLIHVSAAVQHSDLPLMMIGFEIVAVLQVGLGALLIFGRPTRPLLLGGIALMASAVALWAVSRTVGLGFLVEGTHAEPIGFKDGVTVLFELAATAGLAILLEPGWRGATTPAGRLTAPQIGGAAAIAFALFVPALVVGGHQHVDTHAGSLHHAGAVTPHLRGGHPSGSAGGSAHRRAHSDRPGAAHASGHAGGHDGHPRGSTPAHGSHDATLAVAHSHAAAVAPVHDHALASGSGTAPGASHGHAGGGTTTGGGADHGTHPPGHDPGSDYGGAPEQPAPPPEEPAPVLGDVEEEVDKLVP